MSYRPPLGEFHFLLSQVVGYGAVQETERFGDADDDTSAAILAEAGKLSADVLAPLRRVGDQEPARLENGVVRTAPGFADAYGQVAAGGWISVAAPAAYGGMGLPVTLQTAVNDMMSAANLGLHTGILLSQGQIEAIAAHASEDLKAIYLPRLIAGEWMATMNLTEPQAGSDVGALTSRAEPAGDGSYRITGRKIYITYGDSDLAENVVHLVLARLPGAPAGTRGISLFLVPKRLPDAEGQAGAANALRVAGLEHKMGLHASPTCTMEFDGATGWLVGEEGGGMAAMFTMMNNARLSVGVQGVGVACAASQAALDWASERRQGRSPLPEGSATGAIVDHADVRRMLGQMRAETFAARALTLACAVAIDMARATGAKGWADRAALLTPIAKAHGTEVGHRVAQEAIQVLGGMGYIEEAGVAQYARDVRVAAIYEGTNGIQAMDLVGRKLADGGEAAFRLIDEIQDGAEAARGTLDGLAAPVWSAAEALREATERAVAQNMQDRFAGAVPYLQAMARLLGAHHHLRAACAPSGPDARQPLAELYIRRILPEVTGLVSAASLGAADLYALTPEDLSAA